MQEKYIGNKYGYSKVDYKGSKIEVIITCPIHGDFPQKPNVHLLNHGCPDCAKEMQRLKQTMSNDVFIRRAREIHGDKYDYSKVDMYNRDEKGRVCITCPIHR